LVILCGYSPKPSNVYYQFPHKLASEGAHTACHPASPRGEPVVTTGVSQNGQGRASRGEESWYVKVYVCSARDFLEELMPSAM